MPGAFQGAPRERPVDTQLEDGLARVLEARRAAARCPMCQREHASAPTPCLAFAERRHAAVCAHLLGAHAEGCRLEAMQRYAARFAR
jgi:hypothetical protein